MNLLFGAEPLLYPTLTPAVVGVTRVVYGALLLATLLTALPHARRYFLSERWGGYAQRGPFVEALHNPVVMPVLLVAWMIAAVALMAGRGVIAAAAFNLLLCRYFFIQMRWRGVLRGMGAPGFIAYWLGAAVLLLEVTAAHAPSARGPALLVLQVDFALIMFSAGLYKFSAGYPQNHGMELGMVNPEWGYWTRFWGGVAPTSWWFRTFNHLAWGTEVVAALLMLVPPTRFVGGMLILVSFVFIASQIRLGFLCAMVMACCLVFAHPGSAVDVWARALLPAAAPPPVAPWRWLDAALPVLLWAYLFLLPVMRFGLEVNFRWRTALPGVLQRGLDAYTNFFGLILWRVFSADVTNFFVRISEQRPDGSRREVSQWGRRGRYNQVAEAIAVTSLLTTLKYYSSNTALFVERLVRYARTVSIAADSRLVFEYVAVIKQPDRFAFVPAAEFEVDVQRGRVDERVLDPSIPVRGAAAHSPIHEGIRPGSYVPLAR